MHYMIFYLHKHRFKNLEISRIESMLKLKNTKITYLLYSNHEIYPIIYLMNISFSIRARSVMCVI